MTKRLLVLANHDPNDLSHGMGLILNNTYRYLNNREDLEVSYGFLFSNRDRAASSSQQRYEFPLELGSFVHHRPPLGRWDRLRYLLGCPLKPAEASFLEDVRASSQGCDAVLWFGFSAELVSRCLPKYAACPSILHCNDSVGLYQARKASGWLSPFKRSLANLQEWISLTSGYHAHVYVSLTDADYVEKNFRNHKSRVLALPNGVDTEAFCPSENRPSNDVLTLLFTGVMSFEPNVQAARFLSEELSPKLGIPHSLRIVGRTPSDEVKRLAHENPNVIVTGGVEDIVAEYQEADIFVAPIRLATGTKNKVLEAMSCGLPVVTTPEVLSAFHRIEGAVTANSVEDYVKAILELAQAPAELSRLGEAARLCAMGDYSWENRTERLLESCLGSKD